MLLKRTGRAAIAFGVSLVLLVVSSLAFATSADAGTVDDEQLFIQMINQLRTDKGLNPLVVDGELTAQARAWSQSMAANDQLAHTSNLAGGISSPWTVLGENVGVHVIHDVSGLFQAFIASPSHYQNLVDPRFQYVGVGVVNTEAGKLWTTHRFMAATAPPTPAPPTPPPPRPPLHRPRGRRRPHRPSCRQPRRRHRRQLLRRRHWRRQRCRRLLRQRRPATTAPRSQRPRTERRPDRRQAGRPIRQRPRPMTRRRPIPRPDRPRPTVRRTPNWSSRMWQPSKRC